MKFINLRYDIETPFFDNLERLAYEIRNEDDIIFISHSLGGLYALHLYDRLKPKVVSSVSIGAPFGGSLTADWARYILPNYLLFKEIGIRSRPVRTGLGVDIDTIKWIQIVSTSGGVPWHKGENDGVVSVSSQHAHPQMRKIEMSLTHHESLVSPDVCLVLHEEIERNTKIT
jgi:triacylglycerol esterase/lipase EstA (alpha/beta hydrolase family)